MCFAVSLTVNGMNLIVLNDDQLLQLQIGIFGFLCYTLDTPVGLNKGKESLTRSITRNFRLNCFSKDRNEVLRHIELLPWGIN